MIRGTARLPVMENPRTDLPQANSTGQGSLLCYVLVLLQFDILVFCLFPRARGVARLTRLPVTEKIAGSNPVAPAE